MARISKAVRFEVLARDGFRCRYCGAGPNDGAVLHVDHVTSVYRGGQSSTDNLVTACSDCNLGKSDREVLGLPQGFALGPDRRPARMKAMRERRSTPHPDFHQLDTGEIDELDELDEDNQLALVWCDFHRKYEWHYLPRDLIGSGAILSRTKKFRS